MYLFKHDHLLVIKRRVMLEILQILLHSFYKLMCHQSQKSNLNIHLLCFEIHQSHSFPSVCKDYGVKFVVSLAFSLNNDILWNFITEIRKTQSCICYRFSKSYCVALCVFSIDSLATFHH
jgi:uncharacterized membrane protein